MVHLTSGDAVADKIRHWAGEPRIIVWHDILHEGPAPPGLSLEDFTATRIRFLEGAGFGSGDKLLERNRLLRRLVSRDSLWLWFEDDLYDQLQVLQLLDFLVRENLAGGAHFLIDIPRGLQVERMAALAAAKSRITAEMCDTAVRAWDAFTRSTVPALLQTDLSALPHLRPAMLRLLEHRPGNCRVQQTILRLLQDGGKSAGQLFAEYQATEERPFLGDTVFFHYLDALAPRVQKDERGIYRLLPDA